MKYIIFVATLCAAGAVGSAQAGRRYVSKHHHNAHDILASISNMATQAMKKDVAEQEDILCKIHKKTRKFAGHAVQYRWAVGEPDTVYHLKRIGRLAEKAEGKSELYARRMLGRAFNTTANYCKPD